MNLQLMNALIGLMLTVAKIISSMNSTPALKPLLDDLHAAADTLLAAHKASPGP